MNAQNCTINEGCPHGGRDLMRTEGVLRHTGNALAIFRHKARQQPLNAAVKFMIALGLFSGAHSCSVLQGDVIAPVRRPERARQKSSLYTTTVCTGSRPLPHALTTGTSAAVINLDEASSQVWHHQRPLRRQRLVPKSADPPTVDRV